MINKRLISLLLVIILVFANICGCKDSSNETILTSNKEVVLNEGEYQVYYLNESKTALMSKIKKCDNEGTEKIAEELISQMNELLKKEITASPFEVKILGVSFADGIITLDLDEKYLQIKGVTEILLRACIVLTLSQIDNVDYVGITVNGQTIKDEAGNNINKMKVDDFVNYKDDFPYTKKEVTLALYFATTDGQMLRKKENIYNYDYSVSYEEFIVNKLVEGIVDNDDLKEYRSVLPKDTVIDMVYIKDGICYVDFDESIQKLIRPVSTELMLYSIVNSLSELSYITKVQFSIEGECDTNLYNEFDLSDPLSVNLDIVIKEEIKN